MAAAFPWIFPSPHPSYTFIMHVLINRTSWNVTLDDKIHILIFVSFSRGYIPPWSTSLSLYSHSLLVKFKILRLPYYWSIVGLLSLLGHGLRPNMYLGLRPHKKLKVYQSILPNSSPTYHLNPYLNLLFPTSIIFIISKFGFFLDIINMITVLCLFSFLFFLVVIYASCNSPILFCSYVNAF